MSLHKNNLPTYRKGWTTKAGKKKAGFWQLRHEGRYVSLTKYGAPQGDKSKAAYKAALKAAEAFLGEPEGDKATLTVKTVCARYKADRWPTLAASSQRMYQGYFDEFVELFGDMAWAEFGSDQLDQWESKHEWGLSGRRTALGLVKAIFNHAKKKGFIDKHCLEGVSLAQAPARQVVFTDQEIEAIKAKSNSSFATIFEALLDLGARPGELCKATTDHIQYRHNTACLVLSWTEHKTGPKTKKERVIPLPAKLALYAKRQQGHLFTNSEGNPWTPDSLREYLDKTRKSLKLRTGLNPYACRHTFITRQLLSGKSIKLLADYCGTSARVIERNYSKAIDRPDVLLSAMAG